MYLFLPLFLCKIFLSHLRCYVNDQQSKIKRQVIALLHLSRSEEEEKAPVGYANQAAVLQGWKKKRAHSKTQKLLAAGRKPTIH